MEKQYLPVPDAEVLRYKGTEEKPDIQTGKSEHDSGCGNVHSIGIYFL